MIDGIFDGGSLIILNYSYIITHQVNKRNRNTRELPPVFSERRLKNRDDYGIIGSKDMYSYMNSGDTMKTIKVVAAVICDSFQSKARIFATARGYGAFKGQWEFPGSRHWQEKSGRSLIPQSESVT